MPNADDAVREAHEACEICEGVSPHTVRIHPCSWAGHAAIDRAIEAVRQQRSRQCGGASHMHDKVSETPDAEYCIDCYHKYIELAVREENEAWLKVLQHAVYRNHDSPDGCDQCAAIRARISKEKNHVHTD